METLNMLYREFRIKYYSSEQGYYIITVIRSRYLYLIADGTLCDSCGGDNFYLTIEECKRRINEYHLNKNIDKEFFNSEEFEV